VERRDGSVATWIHEIFVNSSQAVLPEGRADRDALDMAIRDATDNRKSLDDVTRALYTRYYQRNKGFTTARPARLAARGRDPGGGRLLSALHQRPGPLPYETVLPKAGIAVARKTQSTVPGRERPTGDSGKLVCKPVPGSAARQPGSSRRRAAQGG